MEIDEILYINKITLLYWLFVLLITLLSLIITPIQNRILQYGKLISNSNNNDNKFSFINYFLKYFVFFIDYILLGLSSSKEIFYILLYYWLFYGFIMFIIIL